MPTWLIVLLGIMLIGAFGFALLRAAAFNPSSRKPFTTDGCSGGMSWGWRKILGSSPPWSGCCLTHDRAYWTGGNKYSRRTADRQLMWCVTLNGHPHIAYVMYLAVRIGGHPLLPLPWRWGYGWTWPRNYRRETSC